MSRKYAIFVDGVQRGEIRHAGGQWRLDRPMRPEMIFDRDKDRRHVVQTFAKMYGVSAEAVTVEKLA